MPLNMSMTPSDFSGYRVCTCIFCRIRFATEESLAAIEKIVNLTEEDDVILACVAGIEAWLVCETLEMKTTKYFVYLISS